MLSVQLGMSFNLNDYPIPGSMSLESQPTTAVPCHRTFSVDSHDDWKYVKSEEVASQEMPASSPSSFYQQQRKHQNELPVDSFGRLASPNDMMHAVYDPFISRPYSPPTTYHFSASSSPSLMSADNCLSKNTSSSHHHHLHHNHHHHGYQYEQKQQHSYLYNNPIYYPSSSLPYGSEGHTRRSSTNTSRSSSPIEGTRPPASLSKRYVCQLCNKRFTRPSSLTTHTYSHTGEKPFKCPVENCGRKFSVVSNLRRHTKIHNSSTSSSNVTLNL